MAGKVEDRDGGGGAKGGKKMEYQPLRKKRFVLVGVQQNELGWTPLLNGQSKDLGDRDRSTVFRFTVKLSQKKTRQKKTGKGLGEGRKKRDVWDGEIELGGPCGGRGKRVGDETH